MPPSHLLRRSSPKGVASLIGRHLREDAIKLASPSGRGGTAGDGEGKRGHQKCFSI